MADTNHMSNDNPSNGRPINPDTHAEPEPAGIREPREQDSEPFDLIGLLSMCFGIFSVLMTPIATTFASPSLWAFAIVAMVCGLIRMMDRRFASRSDMAVAGIVLSAVVIGMLLVMSTQQTLESSIDALNDEMGGICYTDDEYEDCEDDWVDDGDEDLNDLDAEEHGTLEETIENIARMKDKLHMRRYMDDSEDVYEDDEDAQASNEAYEDEKGEATGTKDKDKKEDSEHTMKQVPLADAEDSKMKIIPRSYSPYDMTHKA